MHLNQFSTPCACASVRYRRFRREAWTSFSQSRFSGGTNGSVRSIHYIVYRDGKGNETVILSRKLASDQPGAIQRDILRFTSGIAPGDVTARRLGNHLTLTVKNTGEGADEVITVYFYFYRDGAGGYALNAIEFADGTSWDMARIKTLVQAGTASANAPIHNHSHSHSHSHKSLNGLGGIDSLYGYIGNDALHGGAGIHSLYEGRGNSARSVDARLSMGLSID